MPTCPSCRNHYPEDARVCALDGATLLPDEAFSSADADLGAGQVVGEYRVERKIGQGGFGTVYAAAHPLIGKAAAIKVLSRACSSSPEMVSRFIAEARAVNQVRSRNIIDVFSFGVLPDGRHYYVMELLEGTSLERHLASRGRLSVEEAARILRPIARALDAAHAAGIAHRDLKPDNIFLVLDEEAGVTPKLLDFGLAKLTTGGGEAGHKTRTGMQMGTPYYMSPEQCRGVDVGTASDVYSFGAMLFEALSGRVPFDGAVVMDLMMKHVHEPPPRLSSVCPDLPAVLDEPLLAMMAKDPKARPPSVGAAFEAFLDAARASGFDVGKARTGTTVPIVPAPAPSSPGAAPGTTSPSALEVARTISGSGPSGEASKAGSLLGATRDASRPETGTKKSRAALGTAIALGLVGLGTAGLYLARGAGWGSAVGTTGAEIVMTPEGPPRAASAAEPGTPAPPEVKPEPKAAPSADPRPSRVSLRFETTPPGAEILSGDAVLGLAPGPIELERSEVPRRLTVRAVGYLPRVVEVVPSEDRKIPIALARVPAAPKKPGAGNKDLSFEE